MATDETKLLPLESELAPPPTLVPKIKKKRIIILSFVIVTLLIIAVTSVSLWLFIGKETSSSKPGMIGFWPTFGGGLLNQQKPPNPSNIKFNSQNIQNISMKCTYGSQDGIGFTGYPTIDNNNNTYFTDLNGYITSIDLDTCNVHWKQHVGSLLGYSNNTYITTFQTLTLFQDSDNNEGLLFGTPTSFRWKPMINYTTTSGCYAVALHLDNGTLWWKVALGEPWPNIYNMYNTQCGSHGFFVDGKYAYGGISQGGSYNLYDGSFIGRYYKIDIDKHEIANIWYPFNINSLDDVTYDEYNMSYTGIGMYNYPAIIDDYIVFGTSNAMTVPYKIARCLVANESDDFNDYLLLNDSNYMDMCGNDQSNNNWYRCLEKGFYPTSLIILNKDTFELEAGIPLQGLDLLYPGCSNSANNEHCSGWHLPNKPGITAFNADLTAVSVYKNQKNNKMYVVSSNKPGRLHIHEIPSGKLYLTRKFGPRSGAAQFGMAVDEDNMIGITSINGQNSGASYNLSNNFRVCDGTASVHAFDLNTGNTMWIVINPYGPINDPSCFPGTNVDITSPTTCGYGNFTNNTNNIPVYVLPKSIYEPSESKSRARFYAPVTIIKDMVVIPSETGDIWIVNLVNGYFIHHMTCPNTTYLNNTHNRPGIKGGVSVVNDRMVFYCGSYHNPHSYGNTMISFQL